MNDMDRPEAEAAAAKRKAEDETAAATEGTPQHGSAKKARKGVKSPAVPFRRVKAEEVAVMEELADNTYEGTFGAAGWGAKASEVLLQTRGKSFRHEKTKRKRGSYRGGEIDNHGVNSFKYPDDW